MNEGDITTLQSKYNKLHQLVIIGEQEVVNLKKAKVAEQSEIQRLLRQKDELERQLVSSEKKKETESTELQQVTRRITEEDETLKDRTKQLREVNTEKNALLVEREEIKKDIEKLKVEIKSQHTHLKELTDQVQSKKTNLKTVMDKVKELLKILTVVVVISLLGWMTFSNIVDNAVVVQSEE